MVFDRSRGELVALPDDVLEAGTAFVSGSVHHRASCFVWWKFLLELETDPDRDLSFVEWPEESGGSAAWAEIAARIKALNADPSLVEELPGHRALPPNDLASSPLARELVALGAFRADVTGAGPTVYGLFLHGHQARAAQKQISPERRTWLTAPAWYR